MMKEIIYQLNINNAAILAKHIRSTLSNGGVVSRKKRRPTSFENERKFNRILSEENHTIAIKVIANPVHGEKIN